MKKNVFIILGIILVLVLIAGGGTAFWFYSTHISYQKLASKMNENYDFDISYETEENGYSYSGSYNSNSNTLTYLDNNNEEQSLNINLYEYILNEIPHQKYYKKDKMFTGSFNITSLKQNSELAKFLPEKNNLTCEFEITDNYLSSILCDDDSNFSISFFSND